VITPENPSDFLGAGVTPTLEEVLAGLPPATIPDVVARMRAIDGCLTQEDGVAAFNRLYLAVTEAIEAEETTFDAPEFLARLDVRFALLFFDTLRRAATVPHAWRPLHEARGRAGVIPLQFALAGMNAHINRDLPLALVETWREGGREPQRGGAEHRDFLRVNALLAATEVRVKRSFVTGPLRLADDALGRLDDVLAMWNVERARDAAWTNAETLWRLRGAPELAEDYLRALDRMVGFAGRGLLRPVLVHRPSRLRRLVRRLLRRV
jgi:hypothetical protein